MNQIPRTQVTRILRDLKDHSGDADQVAEILYDHVYRELRNIAGGMMNRERAGHTLQPTALVHEAYFKLVDQSEKDWESRAHFFGVAARAMRQVLVDHARKHKADKRGGDWHRVTMEENLAGAEQLSFEILSLHEALEKLAAEDARMAQVVELRVFAGMLSKEVAQALGVSKRTVDGDWKMAKMWLGRELSETDRS